MAELNYRKLAVNICDAMRIGRKPNPGIKLAEREFGKAFVSSLLKKRTIDLKGFSSARKKTIMKMPHR